MVERCAEGSGDAEMRRALRERLSDLDPGLRPVVEDCLGEASRIDLVARDADGRVTLVLAGRAGEDAALLTRALAHAAWLQPRIPDWLKLAPGLGLDAHAPVLAWLVCPRFGTETRSAARALGAERVRLARFERGTGGSPARLAPESSGDVAAGLPERPGAEAAPARPAFRSGLRDEDLGLTAAERRAFEKRDASLGPAG